MPTTTATANSASQVASGLPNDQAWSNLSGMYGAGSANVTPFYDTGTGGTPSPPASATEKRKSQGQSLVIGFDLSAVPAANSVTAIRLIVRKQKGTFNELGTGIIDLTARLRVSGVATGPELASASQWPVSYADSTYSFTPGSGGLPAMVGSDLANVGALFDAQATGPTFVPLPLADGVPLAEIDLVTMEVDHEPYVPVATRPANRGPRRIPPFRTYHGR